MAFKFGVQQIAFLYRSIEWAEEHVSLLTGRS